MSTNPGTTVAPPRSTTSPRAGGTPSPTATTRSPSRCSHPGARTRVGVTTRAAADDHVRPCCPARASDSPPAGSSSSRPGVRRFHLPDDEPEQDVVDHRVAEPDRDQQPRVGRDVPVEDVVEEAGGEAEPVLDAEGVDQGQRRARQQRVDDVQREGDEHERELERLGDAGEEGGEGGREHDAADELLVLRAAPRARSPARRPGRANIMIGKKPVMKAPAVGSPARKRGMSPVTASPPVVGVLAEDEPRRVVEDVVQAERDQQPVERCRRRSRPAPCSR